MVFSLGSNWVNKVDVYIANPVLAGRFYPYLWDPFTIAGSNAHPRLAYSSSTTFVHYAQNENSITALGQWEEGLECSLKYSI